MNIPVGIRHNCWFNWIISKLPFAVMIMVGFLGVTSIGADDSTPTPAEISLMSPGDTTLGWGFNNGQEFPGATGSLVIDPADQCEGHDALKLTGNFTQGGAYVSAGCQLPVFDNDQYQLSMWLKSRDKEVITLRIVDAKGQCHQIDVHIPHGVSWNHVTIPLGRFYYDLEHNQMHPVSGIVKYSHWGGPNDGVWHGPAKSLIFLIGSFANNKIVTLGISDVSIVPKDSLGTTQNGA